MAIAINIKLNRTDEYYSISSKVLFLIFGVKTHVKWLVCNRYSIKNHYTTGAIIFNQTRNKKV